MTRRTRVLVVDDSAFMRKMIAELLGAEPDVEVVGSARNGEEGVALTQSLRPDVVTLDIEMPVMDGLTALRTIMAKCATPVVMLSSLTADGGDITMRALRYGAADFVHKPSGAISLDIAKVRDELVSKVRAAATVDVRRLAPSVLPVPAMPAAAPVSPEAPRRAPTAGPADRLVAIGTSTGGPRALQAVVPFLPADLPAGVLIVQHMPPKFTKSLADRLNADSQIEVREAQPGDTVTTGVALLAPGDYHMRVTADRRIELTQDPPLWGVRPAVDVMLDSAVRLFERRMLAVVMTGMGRDGRDGCVQVRQAGGRVVAEHEETCVVYGMPRAVVEAGVADEVLPL
ncbi:MAG TPA: chemotaxis response regulator protein-glutamate methylesterase, partial [Armatimonadota bacterium]|nr:chemotaxis response regulator protein-glutamate methylesterase [Armatimonadota bacterium]